MALPPIDGSSTAAATPAAFPSDSEGLAAEQLLPLWPWLLAALALGAGAALLLWRNRSRHAYAGGAPFDAFVAPEPAPAPQPAPVPPQAAREPPSGVVSTRLRPWVELTFRPLRCIVEDASVTIEFEVDVYNSGSIPARAVLVEASLFNAGPAQDQAIGAFFANPAGHGDRISAIPPLKHVSVRTKVVAPRDTVQLFEVGGRQVCIPLIAFNSLYRWGSSEGQTSVSYLLGRDTKGEKMAPFRMDLGPRVFRGVAARLLPLGIKQ